MRGRKTSIVVLLNEQEEAQLQRIARSTALPAGLVTRSRAVLGVARGKPILHVAREVGMTERHVRQWARRFLQQRLQGLRDLPGRGRKPSFSP